MDSRPVLQTFSAVRLPRPVIPVGEALAQFNIRVEAIEGYRLWLKGGRKRQDCLIAKHREKFWVKLERQEVEYSSADSSDESGGRSCDAARSSLRCIMKVIPKSQNLAQGDREVVEGTVSVALLRGGPEVSPCLPCAKAS